MRFDRRLAQCCCGILVTVLWYESVDASSLLATMNETDSTTHESLLERENVAATSCVSTEADLRSRVSQGGIIYLCGGSVIRLHDEIRLVNQASIDVRCAHKNINGTVSTCTLSGEQTTRILSAMYDTVSAKFRNVIFQHGRSIHPGGAVQVLGGSIEFVRCTFRDNWSHYGGAISAKQATTRLTIQDSLFMDNQGHINGGALYVTQRARASIVNTNMTLNDSNGGGGAMYVEKANVVVQDSFMTYNTANGETIGGAALTCRWCDVTLMNTVFQWNGYGHSSDIAIVDDLEPDRYNFVYCDKAQPVTFCNGLAGIREGSLYPPDTNCRAAGRTTHDMCVTL